jgi:hypothetical protein
MLGRELLNNAEADHEFAPLGLPLLHERDRISGWVGDREWVFLLDWSSKREHMSVPQRAQEMVELWLVMPGTIGEGLAKDGGDGVANSRMRVVKDMGSMISWPLSIAERTDLRESQFSEGARSSRKVGSLETSTE